MLSKPVIIGRRWKERRKFSRVASLSVYELSWLQYEIKMLHCGESDRFFFRTQGIATAVLVACEFRAIVDALRMLARDDRILFCPDNYLPLFVEMDLLGHVCLGEMVWGKALMGNFAARRRKFWDDT